MKNYNVKTNPISYKILFFACIVMVLAGFMVSCAPREGWGLVLWAAKDSRLSTGAVIPLYFKSNITRCYIAGLPGTNGKEEIDVWRVKQFSSKRKALAEAKSYDAYVTMFAQAKRQGLVMRGEPDNLSKQVYRFLENERCKIIKKVKGVEVRTGNQVLEGDWYLVLAEDGTKGYIFSNQFTLVDISKAPDIASNIQEPVSAPDFLQKLWRPSYFNAFADKSLYDLKMFQSTYGFFYYASESKIVISLPWFSKSYPAEQFYRNSDGSFRAEPSKLRFMLTADNKLMCIPPQKDVTDIANDFPFVEQTAGGETAFTFAVTSLDIQKLISSEKANRIARLKNFLANGSYFSSTGYGTLIIYENGKFFWESYDALIPDYIPIDAGNFGIIVMDRFLVQNTSGENSGYWQGAFTVYFDNTPPAVVSFAYQFTNGKLLLVPLSEEDVVYEQVRSISSTNVMEFSIGIR